MESNDKLKTKTYQLYLQNTNTLKLNLSLNYSVVVFIILKLVDYCNLGKKLSIWTNMQKSMYYKFLGGLCCIVLNVYADTPTGM